MSEEYLSGFCPRCGEALTVPAKLSEFSCMFCGARLSADELLDTPASPAVSLAPEEAASRFDAAKKQLPSCVRRFRGYQKKVTKNEFEAAFSDVSAGAWYAEAVRWAVGAGVTNGVGEGRFAPDAPCTRAQIVTFLWRSYNG